MGSTKVYSTSAAISLQYLLALLSTAMDGSGGHELALLYARDRSLVVDFALTKYNRLRHPDEAVEATIDHVWRSVTAANPSLFNASKFRLHAIVPGTSSQCTLQLGLTDYKTFQGTHALPSPQTRFGLRSMALPLGNVIIVETSDNCTVLLIRNASVGEGKGACVFPGGHPEPSALDPPPIDGDGERVLRELWDGARREVLEELFLQEGQVVNAANMRFLGIARRKSDAKASMVFFAKVMLVGEELRENYRQNNVEQEETVRIIVKPVRFLRRLADGGLVDGTFVLMPETVGAAQLWVQMADCEHG